MAIMDWAKSARFEGAVAGTTGTAAGTVSGPIMDGDGFESFYAAGYFEATATGSFIKCYTGTATGSLASTPAESSAAQGSVWLNVHRPTIAASATQPRYVQFRLCTTGAAGNAVLMSWAYNPRVQPTSNTTVANGNSFYGTAT